MMNLFEEIKMNTCDDAEINFKAIIPYIKLKIEDCIKPSQYKPNLKNLLLSKVRDEKWAIAQFDSILDYINLLNEEHISNIITGDKSSYAYRYLSFLTRDFIYQVKRLNYFLYSNKLPSLADPTKDLILGWIRMGSHVDPSDVFDKAYTNITSPFIASHTDYTYHSKATPFYIRHAIELKIKSEMLGIERVKNTEKNSPEFILLNRYIEFLKNHGNDFFDLPVPIISIQTVNKWSNNFIHTGIIEHIWEIHSAALAVKDLFEDSNFRKSNFSEADLKISLEKFFKNTDFTFIKTNAQV